MVVRFREGLGELGFYILGPSGSQMVASRIATVMDLRLLGRCHEGPKEGVQ